MKREEAEEVLDIRHPGLFLVRESNNYPGDYTLCVVSPEKKVEHYHILYENNQLTLDKEAFFDTLIPLVDVSLYSIFPTFSNSPLRHLGSLLATEIL